MVVYICQSWSPSVSHLPLPSLVHMSILYKRFLRHLLPHPQDLTSLLLFCPPVVRMAHFSLRSRHQARGWALAEAEGRNRPTTGREDGHRQSRNQGVWGSDQERRQKSRGLGKAIPYHYFSLRVREPSFPLPCPAQGRVKSRRNGRKM